MDSRSAVSLRQEDLVARLRGGDEDAFDELIRRYHGTMLAVARSYVRTIAVAEEVVQEAWLGVSRVSTASRAAPH